MLHLIILHCILQLAEKHVAPCKTILTSTELFFILSFQIGSYELTVYIIWNNILAQKKYCIKLNNNLSYESILNHALEVLINEKLHSTKLELCVNYDPPQYVSEFRVVENLWQWPWLEISLDVIQCQLSWTSNSKSTYQFIILLLIDSSEPLLFDEQNMSLFNTK